MDKLQLDIMKLAKEFVDSFSNRFTFDFSRDSLLNVNDLLEEVRDFVEDQEIIDNILSMAGSYVFEVARKNYGGKYFWRKDDNQPELVAGLPDFSVRIICLEKVKKF